MSRRLGNHICYDKFAYGSRGEAEVAIASMKLAGKLRYGLRAYRCILCEQYHCGRAKRAVRRP